MREFDRVRKKIGDDLAKAAFVREHARQAACDISRQRNARLVRRLQFGADHVGDEKGEIDVCFTQGKLAGLDFRQVEHVVYQRKQVFAGIVDDRRVFGVFVHVGAERLGLNDFRKAQNGVHRRAQFVVHVRQELRFCASRRDGASALAVRFTLGGPQTLNQSRAFVLQRKKAVHAHGLHHKLADKQQREYRRQKRQLGIQRPVSKSRGADQEDGVDD